VVLHKAGQGTTITRPAFLSATSGAVLVEGQCTPTVVPGSSNVVAAASGQFFSLFVKSDGTLWAMGTNSYGQLGLGDLTDRSNPTQVPNVSDVVAVAVGGRHALFLKSDGTVWAMGHNKGELGLGYTGEPIATPTRVPGVRDVVSIAAGGTIIGDGTYRGGISFFVKRDGSLWAVGNGEYGVLGLGDTNGRTSPTRVPFVSDVVSISTGNADTVVLQRDGTLRGAGYNNSGQLGLGDKDPRLTFTQVPDVSNVIAANMNSYIISDAGNVRGRETVHFVTSDGTVYGMGYNSSGVLGVVYFVDDLDNLSTPTRITNFGNVAAVSGAAKAALFLKRDGTLWITGRYGCQDSTSVPVQVDSPLAKTVASLARSTTGGIFRFVTQAPQ
jgi:alpha-tubulin suppressor-like RCC1 family protein